MDSVSRRRLLGGLGASAGGLVGGGCLSGGSDADCPDALEPTHEYTDSSVTTWSRPVLDDRTVFAGSGAGVTYMSSGSRMFRLIALDVSGEPKWVVRRELAGGIEMPQLTDDQVFAPTGANKLFAVDRSTGRAQWEFDAGNNADGNMGGATAVHDETIIAAVNSPSHDVLEGDHHVVALATDDGSVQWTTALEGQVSRGLALIAETLIVVTLDGDIVGIDPETGDREWDVSLGVPPNWFARPVSFAEHAWVPREDGTLVGFDPETGSIVDRLAGSRPDDGGQNGDPKFVQAVGTTDDALIVGDLTETVTAYETDRSERWQYEGDTQAAAVAASADRIGILDRSGIYSELDPETGDPQREFTLTEDRDDARCGNDPSQALFEGLATTRRTMIVTGRLFGLSRYRLPWRD